MSTTPPIPIAPPPWTLKATIYLFATYTSPPPSSSSPVLPPLGYSSLESSHPPFISSSKFLGGLGSVQLIRYTESPVGPYDELLIVPGFFEWEEDVKGKEGGKGKGKGVKRKNARVSRIYVSQRDTCWNGRKNWNIPKHLATFKFTNPTPSTTKIQVSPHENPPTTTPFFTATYSPIPYLPNFPFSTKILRYLGANPDLVQPPLPEGKEEELVGTTEWVKIVPEQFSWKTSLGWWDLKQDGEEGGDGEGKVGEGVSGEENWWPGGGRWRIGARMEEAVVVFGEPEILRLKDGKAML